MFAFGYLDDILMFSENIVKNFIHLRAVFVRLRMADIKKGYLSLTP